MPERNIIPFQLPLPPVLPTIEGNVDYREFRDHLLRIHELLHTSGLETHLLETDLQRWRARGKHLSAKAQQNRQRHSQRALRCNIARLLLKEDFRGFAARLADSPLLQFFCAISEVERVCVPSKITLQRHDQWWTETEVRHLIHQLLNLGAQAPAQLDLAQPLDLESAFLDSTCLAANIHYPVDWVLLRDATRTLMKAVQLIRDQGLKHRMEAPETFLRRINTLCIQMTHAWNQKDSQRQRKRTLRLMWYPNPEADLKGYRLEFTANGTTWTKKADESTLGPMTSSISYTGVTSSAPIYFRLAAVDTASPPNVSGYSDVYGVRLNTTSTRALVVDGFDRVEASGSYHLEAHPFAMTHGMSVPT